MYSKYLLSIISTLYNKLTINGKNYLEIYEQHNVRYKNKNIISLDKDKNKFNKLPYWLDYNDKPRDSNCYCPLENPYLFTGETKEEFRSIFEQFFTPLDNEFNKIRSAFAEKLQAFCLLFLPKRHVDIKSLYSISFFSCVWR